MERGTKDKHGRMRDNGQARRTSRNPFPAATGILLLFLFIQRQHGVYKITLF